MTVQEKYIVLKLVQGNFKAMGIYFINHTYADKYMGGDLEYAVLVTKGMLQNLEAVSLEQLQIALGHIKSCIFAHHQIVYTY